MIVENYRRAASNAIDAGFDGVEIHAANAYLLEQFLRDSTNKRTDAYGGSRENRARLLFEVARTVVAACGSDRVGIRLSPVTPVNDIGPDSDPATTYSYVVEHLNSLGLAYLHVIEGATQGPREVPGGFDLQILRSLFNGCYFANNGYDLALATAARRQGLADMIAFGRAFIANPAAPSNAGATSASSLSLSAITSPIASAPPWPGIGSAARWKRAIVAPRLCVKSGVRRPVSARRTIEQIRLREAAHDHDMIDGSARSAGSIGVLPRRPPAAGLAWCNRAMHNGSHA